MVNDMESLPPDVLRTLVYSSGLTRVEDRTALVLSCMATLQACGGLHASGRGRVATDGGEEHWRREVAIAGYVRGRDTSIRGIEDSRHRRDSPAEWRSLYFDKKRKRCACCDVVITHQTGRVLTIGYQGRGIQLSSCVRCGPIVHISCLPFAHPLPPALVRVFGGYVRRRQVDLALAREKVTREREQADFRATEVRVALMQTGMSPQRTEAAILGSLAYTTFLASSGELLDETIGSLCRRHWLNTYTWLEGACLICGTPFNDTCKNDLYQFVLRSYGGYPAVWPWALHFREQQAQMMERERLADKMVNFYAESMLLDALFQRMIRNELNWLGDHAWLSRIRDASRGTRGVKFVVTPIPGRIAQIMLEADFIGGYRMRRSVSHVTFTVQ